MTLKYWLWSVILVFGNGFLQAEERARSTAWADLVSNDPKASVAFYERLLGWSTRSSNFKDYQYFTLDGVPLAGLVSRDDEAGDAAQAQWIALYTRKDMPESLARAEELGARVLMQPQAIVDEQLAILADPQGAVFGVVSGPFEAHQAHDGPWTWAQLFSPDPGASVSFYEAVLGFEGQANEAGDQWWFSDQGQVKSSMAVLSKAFPQRARWVQFVEVADLPTVLSELPALGGKLIFQPRPEVYEGKMAIIADPQGALLGLMESEVAEAVEEAVEEEQP